MQGRLLAEFGVARVKDVVFEAVFVLWMQRQSEGWTQKRLADAIGRDKGWVSRNLSAPGNWTLRTLGELVQALDGELNVKINPLIVKNKEFDSSNFYSDYLPEIKGYSPIYSSPDHEIFYIMIPLTDHSERYCIDVPLQCLDKIESTYVDMTPPLVGNSEYSYSDMVE